jgi:hypothetical protein
VVLLLMRTIFLSPAMADALAFSPVSALRQPWSFLLQQEAVLRMLHQRCYRLHSSSIGSNHAKIKDSLSPTRCRWPLRIHERGKISGKCCETGG